MVGNLAENIRVARKRMGLTQEELADRLGITLGTISKWERGASEPELSYLMELADVFRISVDALIGFSLRGGDADSEAERIMELRKVNRVEDAAEEYRKALRRYPNHFKIVVSAASCLEQVGIVYNRSEDTREAIKLYRHAIELISQNKDPDINEVMIRNSIAQCYSNLGDYRRAVTEYKENNVCGLNDSVLGLTLIRNERRDAEGIEHTEMAFVNAIFEISVVMCGYEYYYFHMSRFEDAIRVAEWSINHLETLRDDPEGAFYLDKSVAILRMMIAIALDALGRNGEAEENLREAVRMAQEFDKHPMHTLENVIFVGSLMNATVYDDAGPTAMDGLSQTMDELKEYASEELQKIFHKLHTE